MERYIFSGNLTQKMVDYLLAVPEYEPIDALVSQLDRSSIKDMIRHIEEDHAIKSLFIDSGAYSQYTGKVGKIDVDEYIDYVNSIDKYICLIAQLDTLPGKFGKPKHPSDYEKSARLSWENYLYMRNRLKSPEKLIPVMHYGESFDTLKNMLEWRGENGEVVDIIGLSPANDSSQTVKDNYLAQCYNIIRNSSRPDAKTHLFGMTSLQALAKFPCFSADSVSHRLRSAYNKVFTIKWGTISLSNKTRTTRSKSNMNFTRMCDEGTYKEFEELCKSRGFTVEQLCNDNAARTAFDILEIQKAIKGPYKYDDKKLKVPIDLFRKLR